MSVPATPPATGAVFLSYASQDAEAARRICDALRAAGVEVWFDQSELVGGDAWDQKIRRQIKECALFVPVVSVNTQARLEGYFRLEWKLAEDRSHLMAKGKPFLLPVVIDGTHEREAQVPDSFLSVQWTRLPGGETPASFCDRVKALLDSPVTRAPFLRGTRSAGRELEPSGEVTPAAKTWLTPARLAAVAIIVAATAVAVWQPWRRTPNAAQPASGSKTAQEVAKLRARLIPDQWKKEDFEPWSATLDKLIAADDQNAEAWALRSIINSLQVARTFEASTKPLEAGRAAAQRAQLLAPNSPLAELALGMHHAAMISRGGDPQTARAHLNRAFASLPPDPLTRYADLTTAWFGYDFEQVERSAKAWLDREPNADFPSYMLALMNLVLRNATEASAWSKRGGSDRGVTGIRALCVAFETDYYVRADLTTARVTLDQIPPGARTANRVLQARWLLAMAERQWDSALRELARTPESVFFDSAFYGPKAVLAGLANEAAGRPEVALTQFREAERILRELLAGDSQNEPLHALLALILAHTGRAPEARNELALVEPVVRGRMRVHYTGRVALLLAQTHAALGDVREAVAWLRELLSGPSAIPFTPASLRIDPRFQNIMGKPEVQALLAEFAHLDSPKAGIPATAAKSIAVLPFANRSDDKETEDFSDGISEELLNLLGKVPGLRVAGWTSALTFKGKNAAAREIGEKLGVAHYVEGSVRKAGSRVQIRARLTRIDTNDQIWGDTYEEELTDIFALQDKIARDIARKLQLTLGAPSRAASPVNPEAHQLVLEGRRYWNQRTEGELALAEEKFARAVAVDPLFAPAYAGLADACIMSALYAENNGAADVRPLMARGRAAAVRTRELDSTLAEPLAASAYAAAMDGDLAGADQYILKALAINPSHATAHQWRGVLLARQGRLEDALGEFETAVGLDPLAFVHQWMFGEALTFAGRHDDALRMLERSASLRDQTLFMPLVAQLALAELKAGRTENALARARSIRDSWPPNTRWWADGYAVWVMRRSGQQAEAEAYARFLAGKLAPDSYQHGVVRAALGQFDEALPYLARTPQIARRILFWGELFDPYRDARMDELMRKLGCAEDYQRARESLTRMRKEPQAKK